jgi:hypothetical protein
MIMSSSYYLCMLAFSKGTLPGTEKRPMYVCALFSPSLRVIWNPSHVQPGFRERWLIRMCSEQSDPLNRGCASNGNCAEETMGTMLTDERYSTESAFA